MMGRANTSLICFALSLSQPVCGKQRKMGGFPQPPQSEALKKKIKKILLPKKWVGEKLLTDFPGTSIMIIKMILNCKSFNIC